MAASASSLRFLSLTPQSFSQSHHSSPSFPLFTSSSFKPLTKCVISLSYNNYNIVNTFLRLPNSKFVRNVAFSSDLDLVEEDEDADFSGSEEPSYSADVKLFVGNLPFNVDSAALAELFERAGNVEMVEVIYDKVTGRSRGFGFVTMSTVEDAAAAARQFNGYELEGRALRVNSGPPPPKKERSSFREPMARTSFDNTNRVYVGNLAWGVDNLALETLFSEQGKVLEAKVVYDRDSGRSRGFGFVTYSSADEVNNAIESLDGAGARNEIFAMQPAPIQVSYMGFPGTTRATYIHYLVTDEFVLPMQYSDIYSEKLVHLPHFYFVNDYKQGGVGNGFKRKENRMGKVGRKFGNLSLNDGKVGNLAPKVGLYGGGRKRYGNSVRFGNFNMNQRRIGVSWVKREEISDANAAKIGFSGLNAFSTIMTSSIHSLTVGQDVRDRFSGTVEAFSRKNTSGSGWHGEHSRHRTSDVPSSKDVQPDLERGQTSRNGSSSKRAAISSYRPSSSGEPRLVSSRQMIQPGIEPKPSSFSRAAPTKGTRDDPLRSFEFLSIRK